MPKIQVMSQAEAIVKILGVENDLSAPLPGNDSPHRLAAVIRSGLPPSSVESIAAYYGLSKKQMSEKIGISLRTLERHQKDNKLLSLVQSDRLLRYARIAARTQEVFEDAAVAKNWLQRSNSALGGESPLNLLDTETGAMQVDEVLTRIEYGVYG